MVRRTKDLSLPDPRDRYGVKKDPVSKMWSIIDRFHSDLKNLGPDDDIPDDSEAYTFLTEGQFQALIEEATREGDLKVFLGDEEGIPVGVPLEQYEMLENENKELKLKLDSKKEEGDKSASESFRLKKHAFEVILKMVGMHDVNLNT